MRIILSKQFKLLGCNMFIDTIFIPLQLCWERYIYQLSIDGHRFFLVCDQLLNSSRFLGSMLPHYMALCVTYVTFVTFVQKKFRPLLSKVGG